MRKTDRREFLNGTRVASLAAIASTPRASLVSQGLAAGGTNTDAAASFGWEGSFNGKGADIYFRVSNNMILNALNIDAAFVIEAVPSAPGLAEVLCQASVSRGAAPTFDNSQGHAYLVEPASSNFGPAAIYNPNGLAINENATFGQDLFYSVILKAWVPADGTAGASWRQVRAEPTLTLNVGDYLVFHMDHAGVPVDAEMQVVLEYALI
jgi:hypothetical protein